MELGNAVTLRGGAAKPSQCPWVVALYSVTTLVDEPEHGLGASIALFGKGARDPQRSVIVLVFVRHIGRIGAS